MTALGGKLKTMVLAHPSVRGIDAMAQRLGRLAHQVQRVTTAGDLREAARRGDAPLFIVSLEFGAVPVAEAVRSYRRACDGLCLVVGDHASPAVAGRVIRTGANDLVRPTDVDRIYHLASQRFGLRIRRERRFDVLLEVRRPDGEVLGRTRNVSEGGMMLDCDVELAVSSSVAVALTLPSGAEVRGRYDVLEMNRRERLARLRCSWIAEHSVQALRTFLDDCARYLG
jgi:hypothetical protein